MQTLLKIQTIFLEVVNSNISKSFFYEKIESTTLSSYKDQLKEYKYVLCPPGNGIDTHRIWKRFIQTRTCNF